MARYTNQAQLSYGTTTVSSNVAAGEVIDDLTISKSVVLGTYSPGETLTYVVSLINSGTTALTGVSVNDSLGSYAYGTISNPLYPLTYVDGSVQLYTNGVQSAAPTVSAVPPLIFSNITIPAGGNVILVYESTVNEYAQLAAGSQIVNTATASGEEIAAITSVEAVATVDTEPVISITKTIEPVPVSVDGTVTYTFTIENSGATALTAADTVITDTLNPALSGLSATLNGTPLTVTTDYTYQGGVFSTIPGRITVPAATYVQNASTGVVTTVPGVTTLVLTGTV